MIADEARWKWKTNRNIPQIQLIRLNFYENSSNTQPTPLTKMEIIFKIKHAPPPERA